MGHAGKKLKSALASQQTRLKSKQKAAQAAQAAEQQAKRSTQRPPKNKGKAKAHAPERRPTIPFRLTDSILLIGEGNFSFARALIQDAPAELEGLPPGNITATAYDSEEECYEKYPEAEEIVSLLRERGVEVHFSIDATKLDKTSSLKGRKWDRIVWNFPHAGRGIADQDRNILSNQVLILGFLRTAGPLLKLGPVPSVVTSRKRKRNPDDDDDDEEEDKPDNVDADDDDDASFPSEAPTTRGTIHITLRNVPPYTMWDVPKLAKKPPLPTSGSMPPNPEYLILRSFAFHRRLWKGYEHRMTKGERAHGTGKTGEGGEDRMWEFCLRENPEVEKKVKMRVWGSADGYGDALKKRRRDGGDWDDAS